MNGFLILLKLYYIPFNAYPQHFDLVELTFHVKQTQLRIGPKFECMIPPSVTVTRISPEGFINPV